MNEDRLFDRRAVILVLALTVARLLYLLPLDVLPDEADNFVWSQHLALGYYDQPPLLMWLLALAYRVLGSKLLAVRVVPALLGMATTWYAYRLARDCAGPRQAFRFLACLLATPLFFGGGMFATPDAPMVACLAGATYYLRRALSTGAHAAWRCAGLFSGLALLSKFVAGLTVGSFALVLLLPEHRRWLSRREPWLALALALLLFAPVIGWNWRHDWVAFGFQWRHGLGTDRLARGPFLLDYIGRQLMVVGPIALAGFLAAVVAAAKRWDVRSMDERLLTVVAATPFLFFLASSFLKPAEANWPCYAYLPGLLLLVRFHEERRVASRAWRVAWKAGWGLTVVALCAALIQVYYPVLPVQPDRGAEFWGWRQLGLEADRLARTHPAAVLAANHYQVASELVFHSQAPVLCLNIRNRPNQYDLWQDRASWPGTHVLLFHDRPAERSRIFGSFADYREVEVLTLTGPGRPEARRIYVYEATLK